MDEIGAAAPVHIPRAVERTQNPLNEASAKANLVECPGCHWPVPANELTGFTGRKMCRNCIAGWFGEDDDAEDGKSDARS
jgi:hypothetical protein